MDFSLVWFKRDLRVADHGALAAAARQGPVLCVVIVEPTLWAQPDAARQHYAFMLESARELHAELRRVGAVLPEPSRLHFVSLPVSLQPGECAAWPQQGAVVATRAAKARVHALRAHPEVRAAKAAIVERHGSRKRSEGRRRKAAASAGSAAQLDLEF